MSRPVTAEKQQRLISTIAASDASYCRPSVTASHRSRIRYLSKKIREF